MIILEQYFGIAFLVVGLSHILQSKMWADFFVSLNKTGYAAMIIAFFTFPQGLIIVILHNIWVWDLRVVLTIVGWGMLLKSANYLINPKIAQRMIEGPGSVPKNYVVAGIFSILLGCAIAYPGFF